MVAAVDVVDPDFDPATAPEGSVAVLSALREPDPAADRTAIETVVDAYLSPILRTYVSRVDDSLEREGADCSLMFMRSNGGLTAAELLQGKDAILSGPAGGVVGMVKTSELAGFSPLGAAGYFHPTVIFRAVV